MKIHQKICISCPAGCHLEIKENGDGTFDISGNTCPRGKTYAINEMTDPRRVVTAVVATDSAVTPYLPVKTDAPLPFGSIQTLLKKIYAFKLELPAKSGMLLIENIDNTGVNLILTRGSEK
ncbi:MAG: DUF1667 domain-containing protein [Lentisphaeria bacterium]|nr:DUF1667 domain-containing protein [Lentisphaeria bacterium]